MTPPPMIDRFHVSDELSLAGCTKLAILGKQGLIAAASDSKVHILCGKDNKTIAASYSVDEHLQSHSETIQPHVLWCPAPPERSDRLARIAYITQQTLHLLDLTTPPSSTTGSHWIDWLIPSNFLGYYASGQSNMHGISFEQIPLEIKRDKIIKLKEGKILDLCLANSLGFYVVYEDGTIQFVDWEGRACTDLPFRYDTAITSQLPHIFRSLGLENELPMSSGRFQYQGAFLSAFSTAAFRLSFPQLASDSGVLCAPSQLQVVVSLVADVNGIIGAFFYEDGRLLSTSQQECSFLLTTAYITRLKETIMNEDDSASGEPSLVVSGISLSEVGNDNEATGVDELNSTIVDDISIPLASRFSPSQEFTVTSLSLAPIALEDNLSYRLNAKPDHILANEAILASAYLANGEIEVFLGCFYYDDSTLSTEADQRGMISVDYITLKWSRILTIDTCGKFRSDASPVGSNSTTCRVLEFHHNYALSTQTAIPRASSTVRASQLSRGSQLTDHAYNILQGTVNADQGESKVTKSDQRTSDAPQHSKNSDVEYRRRNGSFKRTLFVAGPGLPPRYLHASLPCTSILLAAKSTSTLDCYELKFTNGFWSYCRFLHKEFPTIRGNLEHLRSAVTTQSPLPSPTSPALKHVFNPTLLWDMQGTRIFVPISCQHSVNAPNKNTSDEAIASSSSATLSSVDTPQHHSADIVTLLLTVDLALPIPSSITGICASPLGGSLKRNKSGLLYFGYHDPTLSDLQGSNFYAANGSRARSTSKRTSQHLLSWLYYKYPDAMMLKQDDIKCLAMSPTSSFLSIGTSKDCFVLDMGSNEWYSLQTVVSGEECPIESPVQCTGWTSHLTPHCLTLRKESSDQNPRDIGISETALGSMELFSLQCHSASGASKMDCMGATQFCMPLDTVPVGISSSTVYLLNPNAHYDGKGSLYSQDSIRTQHRPVVNVPSQLESTNEPENADQLDPTNIYNEEAYVASYKADNRVPLYIRSESSIGKLLLKESMTDRIVSCAHWTAVSFLSHRQLNKVHIDSTNVNADEPKTNDFPSSATYGQQIYSIELVRLVTLDASLPLASGSNSSASPLDGLAIGIQEHLEPPSTESVRVPYLKRSNGDITSRLIDDAMSVHPSHMSSASKNNTASHATAARNLSSSGLIQGADVQPNQLEVVPDHYRIDEMLCDSFENIRENLKDLNDDSLHSSAINNIEGDDQANAGDSNQAPRWSEIIWMQSSAKLKPSDSSEGMSLTDALSRAPILTHIETHLVDTESTFGMSMLPMQRIDVPIISSLAQAGNLGSDQVGLSDVPVAVHLLSNNASITTPIEFPAAKIDRLSQLTGWDVEHQQSAARSTQKVEDKGYKEASQFDMSNKLLSKEIDDVPDLQSQRYIDTESNHEMWTILSPLIAIHTADGNLFMLNSSTRILYRINLEVLQENQAEKPLPCYVSSVAPLPASTFGIPSNISVLFISYTLGDLKKKNGTIERYAIFVPSTRKLSGCPSSKSTHRLQSSSKTLLNEKSSLNYEFLQSNLSDVGVILPILAPSPTVNASDAQIVNVPHPMQNTSDVVSPRSPLCYNSIMGIVTLPDNPSSPTLGFSLVMNPFIDPSISTTYSSQLASTTAAAAPVCVPGGAALDYDTMSYLKSVQLTLPPVMSGIPLFVSALLPHCELPPILLVDDFSVRFASNYDSCKYMLLLTLAKGVLRMFEWQEQSQQASHRTNVKANKSSANDINICVTPPPSDFHSAFTMLLVYALERELDMLSGRSIPAAHSDTNQHTGVSTRVSHNLVSSALPWRPIHRDFCNLHKPLFSDGMFLSLPQILPKNSFHVLFTLAAATKRYAEAANFPLQTVVTRCLDLLSSSKNPTFIQRQELTSAHDDLAMKYKSSTASSMRPPIFLSMFSASLRTLFVFLGPSNYAKIVASAGRIVDEEYLPLLFPALDDPMELFVGCITRAKRMALENAKMEFPAQLAQNPFILAPLHPDSRAELERVYTAMVSQVALNQDIDNLEVRAGVVTMREGEKAEMSIGSTRILQGVRAEVAQPMHSMSRSPHQVSFVAHSSNSFQELSTASILLILLQEYRLRSLQINPVDALFVRKAIASCPFTQKLQELNRLHAPSIEFSLSLTLLSLIDAQKLLDSFGLPDILSYSATIGLLVPLLDTHAWEQGNKEFLESKIWSLQEALDPSDMSPLTIAMNDCLTEYLKRLCGRDKEVYKRITQLAGEICAYAKRLASTYLHTVLTAIHEEGWSTDSKLPHRGHIFGLGASITDIRTQTPSISSNEHKASPTQGDTGNYAQIFESQDISTNNAGTNEATQISGLNERGPAAVAPETSAQWSFWGSVSGAFTGILDVLAPTHVSQSDLSSDQSADGEALSRFHAGATDIVKGNDRNASASNLDTSNIKLAGNSVADASSNNTHMKHQGIQTALDDPIMLSLLLAPQIPLWIEFPVQIQRKSLESTAGQRAGFGLTLMDALNSWDQLVKDSPRIDGQLKRRFESVLKGTALAETTTIEVKSIQKLISAILVEANNHVKARAEKYAIMVGHLDSPLNIVDTETAQPIMDDLRMSFQSLVTLCPRACKIAAKDYILSVNGVPCSEISAEEVVKLFVNAPETAQLVLGRIVYVPILKILGHLFVQ